MTGRTPAAARLRYAYADALDDAGRTDEARHWFGKAAAADPGGLTDAADRVENFDLLIVDDLADFEDDTDDHTEHDNDTDESALTEGTDSG